MEFKGMSFYLLPMQGQRDILKKTTTSVLHIYMYTLTAMEICLYTHKFHVNTKLTK